MRLDQLLEGIYPDSLGSPYNHWDIRGVCSDSRKVKKDSLFIARDGMSHRGEEFIDEAISRGARVIVGHRKQEHKVSDDRVCYLALDIWSFILILFLHYSVIWPLMIQKIS